MGETIKKHWLEIAIVLAILGGGTLFLKWLFGSEPKVIGAIVALFGILAQQWYSKKREIAEAHREKKAEIYSKFIEIVRGFLDGKLDTPDERGKPISKELRSKLNDLSDSMIIWASPGVIKAWIKYKDVTNTVDPKTDVILTMDTLLREMRKDLGNSNFGLEVGDIVQMYQTPRNTK